MSYITLKKEKKNKINNFKKKLFQKIEEPEFKSKLERLLNEIDFCKANIRDNELIYKITKPNEEIIKISIMEHGVYYSKKNSTTITTGIYHRDPSGKIYTKYSNKETVIYKNSFQGVKNSLYDVYNINERVIFNVFDENLVEIWYMIENKDDTYYQNKKTKEKILPKPDCFENYIEKEYYFREEPNLIIKRAIKKYHHPENGDEIKNEDNYLIAKNNNPTSKQISRGGYYFGFPKEFYFGYKSGKYTQEEMWNSKVKVRNYTTYF